ncbi:exo-alpha-sialidase [candidate division KSB1 bacterium]|nr:exo-alpha-sialidase [candidate division KSB1 bacterium]
MDQIDVRALPGAKTVCVVKGSGYFPVIADIGGGELAIVLRGGAPHIGIGGRLDLVRSGDGGITWSEPQVIVDSEKDDRNPAFGVAANGDLVLGYHWQAGYDDDGTWNPGPYKQDTKLARSNDRGKTWEKPVFLGPEIHRGNSPFGKVFKDSAGTLYMPVYGAKNPEPGIRISSDTTYTFLLVSTDHGKSWGRSIEVAHGLNEADYLILPDGDWLCAARSQKRDEQAIYTCRSKDKGESWSQPQRVTEGKEHPPDLTLLSDGSILLVFGVRHEPFGIQGMVSRDSGHTWLTTRLLFADDLPGTDIGYPSTVRMADGRLVTVYYRKDGIGKFGDPDFVGCFGVVYDEQALLAALTKAK